VPGIKAYGEWGHRSGVLDRMGSEHNFYEWLGGLSIERSDKLQLRCEYLARPKSGEFIPAAASSSELQTFFPGKELAIGSVSFLDIFDRLNIFVTGVKAVGNGAYLGVSHGDLILNDQMNLGLTYIGFSQNTSGFARMRPFNEQLAANLRWSF
jgi:hypothetical protein